MFDAVALSDAIAAHGRTVRVVVAAVQGSAPREVGAAMLVWTDGQSGTIGGGALEYRAIQTARDMLANGATARQDSIPLGPNLGQCCGGAVKLISEAFTSAPAQSPAFARPVLADVARADAREAPLAILRALSRARRGHNIGAIYHQGWFVEPMSLPQTPVWIWGAGHVGRALAQVLAPLPQLAITWVDTERARFPHDIAQGIRVLPAADMMRAVDLAPIGAHHVVMTFSHAIDLALCDGLLRRGFQGLGLIGSASKWARFRARLSALGHPPAAIARICCPIGDPSLGKHPQAIAIGVAAMMMQDMARAEPRSKEARA